MLRRSRIPLGVVRCIGQCKRGAYSDQEASRASAHLSSSRDLSNVSGLLRMARKRHSLARQGAASCAAGQHSPRACWPAVGTTSCKLAEGNTCAHTCTDLPSSQCDDDDDFDSNVCSSRSSAFASPSLAVMSGSPGVRACTISCSKMSEMARCRKRWSPRKQ